MMTTTMKENKHIENSLEDLSNLETDWESNLSEIESEFLSDLNLCY